MDFSLEHGPLGKCRPVFGHHDVVLIQLQQLNLLAVFTGAQNQANRRVFAFLSLIAVEPAKVKLHLPLVRGLELADLQFHRHQSPQPAMEEQQIEVKILAVDDHAFLALDEGEAPAQLQNEALQFPQDGSFQVCFQETVVQPKHIQQIGVFERVEWDGGAFRQLAVGDLLALEPLAGDELAQLARAKLASCRLFEVEEASFRRFQRQHLDHVRPTQLCSHCRHNPEIRELLGELHHAAQVARLEAAPVAGHQLCRQRRHNLLPVFSALVVKDFAVDLLPDAPEQIDRGAACLPRQRASGFLDQARHRGEKVVVRGNCDGAPGFLTRRHRRSPQQNHQAEKIPLFTLPNSTSGRHQWTSDPTSLADAEAGEDAAQQIIGAEFAGDAVQRVLAQAQLFGQQVQRGGR